MIHGYAMGKLGETEGVFRIRTPRARGVTKGQTSRSRGEVSCYVRDWLATGSSRTDEETRGDGAVKERRVHDRSG